MRLVRVFAAVVAALLAIALTSPARAQGAAGQVPDPVSTMQLHKLMERYAKPTTAQWDAIESVHDDYREAFRQLREGEIEKFLVEMRGMESGGMPSKKTVEDFLRKYEHVNNKIEELDKILFDGVATILGDGHEVAVKRIRAARERDRTMSSLMREMMGGEMPVDLSEIAWSGASEEDRAKIDPLLIPYEERLTTLCNQLNDNGRHMMVDMIDAMEKAGLGGMTNEQMMQDPEQMKHVMEVAQEAFKNAGAKMRKSTDDMRTLASKTFRSLIAELPPQPARRLRMRYVNHSYSQIAWASQQTERFFRAALRIKALDDPARTTIQNQYDAWMKADDALLDEGMKLVDGFEKNKDPLSFDGTQWQTFNEETQKIHAQRDALGTKALDELKAVVGDKRIEKMLAKAAAPVEDVFAETGDPDSEDAASPAIAVSASPGEEMAAMEAMGRGGSLPLPVATVARLGARLKLDDTNRSILETMHGDYVKRWEEAITPAEQAAQKAQQEMWSQGEDGGFHPDASKRDTYYARRREAIEKAGRLDDTYFDDVVKTFGEEHAGQITLARLERALDRFGGASAMGHGWFGRNEEQSVNPIEVISSSDLSDEERGKAEAAFLERAEKMIATYRASAFEQLDLERKTQEMQEKWQATMSGENRDMAEQTRFGMQMMEIQQKVAEAAEQRSEVTRETFTDALGRISEESRAKLQLAYDRRAYPTIFNDERSALPYLEKAESFSDLNDEQRTQMKALHHAYETEYMEACRKMVPKRVPIKAGTPMQERFAEQMESTGATERVRFDRDERSARAVSQLRRILSEEQQKRIPGLVDYEKRGQARNANGMYQTIVN